VPHRVIQWGTGNAGAHTLRVLLEDPAFDVVGVWVKREQNIGRTAGELAGAAGGRLSILISRVISRSPDLGRCELSHVMSSAFCLKLVSFLEPLHPGSLRHARLSACAPSRKDGIASRDSD
jgi:hypothetical protein